ARVKELGAVHSLHVLARRELYGKSILALQEATAAVTREEYLASFEAERRLAAQLEAALAGYDALLTPANPWPALRWDDWPSGRVFEWFRFCWPFNLVRWPAITLPWTLGDEGVPVAFQLVARPGKDERLLGVAALAEARAAFDRAPVEPELVT